MRVPLKTSAFLLAIICCISVKAQSKQEVFIAFQQIVSRAVGEKIDGNSLFSKEPDKITKQVFTETIVSLYTKNMEKKSTEWVNRYSNISWGDIFDHDIFTDYKNNDLQRVKIRFKKNFKSEFFPSDKDSDDDPSSTNSLELYIQTKDKAEFEKNMTLLYSFKPKKAESPFNAQIRRFTKDQTIQWLQAKLQEHMHAGQYGSNIKIVSLSSCSLVVTYKGLVRSYEETLPTSIKAINQYGKFEYNGNDAAIRTTTPDMIDDGKKKYGKYSSSIAISTRDEEVMDNIQCAFKQLSTFCGGSSGITSTTTTSSSSSSVTTSSSTPGFAGVQDQWYMSFSKITSTGPGLQAWVTTEKDFPSATIQEKWKQDYYITDISYGGPSRNWVVVLSKMPGYSEQVWRLRNTRAEASATIHELWKQSYSITTLAYINNNWVIVASKGPSVQKVQALHADLSFPEQAIKDYWGKEHDITSMAYSPEGWLVVMTQGYNFIQRYKKFETAAGWKHDQILANAKEGFYMTAVSKADNTWYVLFNKETKTNTSDYLNVNTLNLHQQIQPMWDKFYCLEKFIYIPTR